MQEMSKSTSKNPILNNRGLRRIEQELQVAKRAYRIAQDNDLYIWIQELTHMRESALRNS